VLDDVERWRFLVEPAGEHPLPALVGLLHVDLDEGAGQLLLLPRRGRFAGAKPDDHVLPPRRLARVESDVLDDPVALVEDAEHGHPLCHRRDAALAIGGRCDLPRTGRGRILLLRPLPAGGERDGHQQRSGGAVHAYSGIQGS
jgi:hypothetical protein